MNYEILSFKSFTSQNEAWNYMFSLDYENMDNERFAYLDDQLQMDSYNNDRSLGCCGFHDETIIVNGRLATIGCNYGH